jgi:hypothetical protein
MLTLPDDAIILDPVDLANCFGSHLVIMGADGKVQEGTELPDQIYIRYEPTKELLYIDSRIFGWLELEGTIKQWRKSQQYAGVMVKRMASGTGRTDPPRNVVVFDLSEKPEERSEPIRPRRGRPLTVEKTRARQAVAEKSDVTMLTLNRKINALKETYAGHPLLIEMEQIFRDTRKLLEEVNQIAVKGHKRGPRKGANKKRHVPQEERIHVKDIDAFIKNYIGAVHRISKRFVERDGKRKLEDRQVKPELPISDWIGRYEHVENPVTGHESKTLYIPVNVLKAVKELENYRMDYRHERNCYRHIGNVTRYCARFDMGRKFVGKGG